MLLPAVALLNRLRYPQKFALISLFFILPLALVLFLLISEINSRVVFAQKEKDGDTYLRGLRVLMEHVPVAKQAAHDLLLGEVIRQPDLSSIQVKIDKAFADSAGVDRLLGEELRSTGHFNALRDNWGYLKQKSREIDGETSAILYDKLLKDLRGLISLVGDSSNLILDPDLDTYYLMDAVLLKLPEKQELVSRLQYRVYDLLRSKTISPHERAELIVLCGLIRSNNESLVQGLDVAFKNNPAENLRLSLEGPLHEFTAATDRMLTETEKRIIQPDSIDMGRDEFTELSRQTLERSFGRL
ncbi:hypothetical protein HY256_01955, partial [Candidatus Sumerlaeota bacterium]|nr:hypothetical protein [Candidatus Sumerlaeota bacterium]